MGTRKTIHRIPTASTEQTFAEPSNGSTDISGDTLEQSSPFVGEWNRLISTTNWEKGKIIVTWRLKLAACDSSPSQYSDEAWSRIVGGVSPQHVGRLRRTFERFGNVFQTYAGIFWSHFYAALEWNDAEMWLEGASQNRWSVSQMRTQRWESLGEQGGPMPESSEIVVSEVDEELASLAIENNQRSSRGQNFDEYFPGPRDEKPDFGDEPALEDSEDGRKSLTNNATIPSVPLFSDFSNLPEDVGAVCEDFKLAIIRHKGNGWSEISREQMVGILEALIQLTI